MLAIFSSAFAGAFRFLIGAGGVKMIMVLAIGWIMNAVIGLILPLLPTPDFLQEFASAMSSGTMWWLELMQFPACVAISFGFLGARFLLKRIPFIGG